MRWADVESIDFSIREDVLVSDLDMLKPDAKGSYDGALQRLLGTNCVSKAEVHVRHPGLDIGSLPPGSDVRRVDGYNSTSEPDRTMQ